ncbi:MAG: hypothetical protein J0L88_11670 [Xanthomonadales bacterium]|nr:hypothetical protein [Xanthomonadales bacterium]
MTVQPVPNRLVAATFAVLVAAKLVLLAIDPAPRMFLGDSASYLHAAATGWVPPDRSYAYPLFIRLVTHHDASLLPLLLAQSMLGVATALIMLRILAGAFGLDARIAAAMACVFALGPEQLFYERMVMAESGSLFALAAMLAAGFAYLRDGRLAWLPCIALCGALATAYRISVVPFVLGFAALPIAVRFLTDASWSRRTVLRAALHGVAALALCGVAQAGVQRWYDAVFDMHHEYRADYSAHSGFFRLSLVLPLVQPGDAKRVGLAPGFIDALPPGWNDYRAREQQLWGEDTFIARMRAQHGDVVANRMARKLAARALRHDPMQLFVLATRTLGDYFDPETARPRLRDDMGERTPTRAEADAVRQRWGFDPIETAAQPSPVGTWFSLGAPWLVFCLFALVPLAVVTLATGWRHQRAASMLLALASLGLFLGHALFSAIVSYRYLHAFALFVLLNLGAIVANLVERRRLQSPGREPVPR